MAWSPPEKVSLDSGLRVRTSQRKEKRKRVCVKQRKGRREERGGKIRAQNFILQRLGVAVLEKRSCAQKKREKPQGGGRLAVKVLSTKAWGEGREQKTRWGGPTGAPFLKARQGEGKAFASTELKKNAQGRKDLPRERSRFRNPILGRKAKFKRGG